MRKTDSTEDNSRRIQHLLIIVFGIGSDQLAKYVAASLLITYGNVEVWKGIVQFSLVYNPGGFLSILKDIPEPLRYFLLNICIGLLLLAGLFYLFFYAQRRKILSSPLAWICAGGLSNLLDRFLHQEGVIDFVSIGISHFRTGIFNLADVYILAASFWLGFLVFRESDDK